MSGVRRAWRLAAVLALALAVGACTGDEAIPEPAEVETCDGLADVGVQLVRAYARLFEQVSIEALADGEPIPEMVELERIGDDLDASVARLGCDAADLNARIAAEVGDLASDSPALAVLLQVVREGVVTPPTVESIPPVTPTTTAG